MSRHTVQELWQEIQTIKNNHLEHLKEDIDHMKKDMDKMDKKIEKVDSKVEKMDAKLWWALGILVTTVVLPAVVTFLKTYAP